MERIFDGKVVRLSLLEILLLCQRVLRAAKVPFGCVNEATKLIQWAEINGKSGLSHLYRHLDDLKYTTLDYRSNSLIDAHGASSLIAGPCALDLACDSAESTEIGVVSVDNSKNGYPFLDYLPIKATDRGYVCLLMYSGLKNNGEHFYKSILAIPSNSSPFIIEKNMESMPRAFSTLAQDKEKVALNEISKEELVHLLINVFVGNDSQEGIEKLDTFTLVCIKKDLFNIHALPESKVVEELKAFFDKNPDDIELQIRFPEEISTRQKCVVENGMAVDKGLWRKLVDFGDQILMPESEKSRKDAG